MNFLKVFGAILFSLVLVYAQGLTILQNTSGHEIIDGNCTNATVGDMVYFDYIDKWGFPFIVRSEEVEYYGDGIIYCITALNQKSDETGGTSNVTSGGVGHSYVNIDLESFRGEGLEFYVSIYARNSTRQWVRKLIRSS